MKLPTTDIREADFIHCTIFENYSRFAGALQVPPSTTTRLLNSLLHGNESRESAPAADRVVTATADSSAPVGTVVVSGTNHQSGAFASGITPAADSYSAVPRMAWDGIHLASPTATNGQSLLGRTVVAHTLTTNPIGMGTSPPTDWDNEHNLDPRSATGSNGAAADIDGDGLSNLDESRHGTNPNSADTDSDGRSDAQETQNGSDPDTFDQPVPPGLMRLVRFRFGDPSGSLSEKYRLAISGFDGRQFSSVNAGFNIVDGVDWQFRSGIRYTVSLHYLATKMSDGFMRPQPDYDCEVLIETDSTPNGLFQPNVTMGPGVNWRTAPNPSGEYFPITLRRKPANGLASLPPSTWIADNQSHVLGQHWKPDFHNSKFEIQGKSALLIPIEVKEVRFDGPQFHRLTSDSGNIFYDAPQWVDVNGDGAATTNNSTGEKNYPVSFTRNARPKIGGTFKATAFPSGVVVKIRANSAQGIQIPETLVTPSADGTITLPLTFSLNRLIDSIQFYNAGDSTAFKIDWEINIANGPWSVFGSTKHTVCVLLGDPITTLRQETLAILGCKNAVGETSEASAREKIYNDFTDRVVKRVDGKQMTYWMNDQMGCTDTSDLLSRTDGNGNCQSWAGLFRDVLRFQGIPADRIMVWPKSNDSSVIVKRWTFWEPPHGPANHPYIVSLDAIDVDGIPAQGNSNPPGSFNGHWITESGSAYYDPSYGTPAVRENNKGKLYEDSALEGFGAIYINPNAGGQFKGIRKNDTSTSSAAEVNYLLDN